MWTETDLLLFVAPSLALLAVPVPDTVSVLTRGISGGRKVALDSATGVCAGLCLHTVFAAVGPSAVLRESALALVVLRGVALFSGAADSWSRERFPGAEEGNGDEPSVTAIVGGTSWEEGSAATRKVLRRCGCLERRSARRDGSSNPEEARP